MLASLSLGLAAVVFMLGIISMQLGSIKSHGMLIDGMLALIFLGCIGIAGLLVMQALVSLQA